MIPTRDPAEIVNQPSTVLMVDDNPLNLQLLHDVLYPTGFKLLAADSGEAALEQIEVCKPDIILLDIMMPGLDGFDTCRCLKENPDTAHIPVIFMTALADSESKVQGLSIGAVDYITKPIHADETLARVKTHLMVHHLQQQLQYQNDQLLQEIRERSQIEQSLKLLLRGVSHDLRNPVNGMIMVLNNLMQGVGGAVSGAPPDGSVSASDAVAVPRRILDRMLMSSERQLQLINSLLETHAPTPSSATPPPSASTDATRPERSVLYFATSCCDTPTMGRAITRAEDAALAPTASVSGSSLDSSSESLVRLGAAGLAIELHRQPVAIAPLIDSLLQDLQPLIQQHPATLNYQVAAALPAVDADPTQLWRVIENLITNAIKHNPPGVAVTVTAALLPAGAGRDRPTEALRFTVHDNGRGIPLAEQATLFNPYQRGSAVGETPGQGLGLYLCQEIIKAHASTIDVVSDSIQGTTFSFSLPCVDRAA